MPEINANCVDDAKIFALSAAEHQAPSSHPTQPVLHELYADLGFEAKENIDTIVKKAFKLFGGDFTYYCRFCGSDSTVSAWAGKTVPENPGATIPLGESAIYDAFRNNDAPVVIEDLRQSPFADSDPAVTSFGCGSCLGCQVTNEAHTVGALCVLDKNKRKYSPEEIQIISILAKAISLEEAHLQKELELSRSLVLEKMLKDICSRALRAENTKCLFDKCLEIMDNTLAVDAAYLYQYQAENKTVKLFSKRQPEILKPKGLDLSAIPAPMVKWSLKRLMKGEILNISDTEDIPTKQEKAIAKGLRAESFLSVPMFIRSEFIGCLGFEDFQKGRVWSEQDIDILKTTAKIISKAYENLRLRKQLRAAIGEQEAALSATTRKLNVEIKERKRTIARLSEKEKELARKHERLKDMNKALSVLFSKHNDDISQMEEQMAHNIREIINPSLQRLKKGKLTASQRKWMHVLETALNDIASPLVLRLSIGFRDLTPTEIKIATFIKHGHTNKEISELLSISARTVEVHRCSIRKKIGLKNRQINLRTYLLSVE